MSRELHDREIDVLQLAGALTAVAQDFADFELIVADDGSTDGTVAALAPFAPGVRAIEVPAGGKPLALNAAVAIDRVIEGKKVPVYGKGENVRDWIHVDDHNRAVILAAGAGTRLESVHAGAPKGLIPVRGVSILARIIAAVRDAGFSSPNSS